MGEPIAQYAPQRLTFVRAVLVLALAGDGFALTLLVFYPGYLTEDASYIHDYVESGYLGDWQSPLMTLVWRLIDPLAPGAGSMFTLIAALYWTGFALTALAVARRSIVAAAAVIVLALAPPAFMMLAMIWRDILFGAAWLAAAAMVYVTADRPWRARSLVQAVALVLVGFGVLLRPNALIAAPLLVAYVAWPVAFAWKRALVLFVPAVLGGYGAIQIVYYGILDVHRENVLQSVFVFDLGGMTHVTQQNQFPVTWSAEENALLLTRCYNPAQWDPYWTQEPCRFVMTRLQRQDDVIFGTSRLPDAWLRAVAAHPLAYLTHRLTFFWTFLAGENPTLELEKLETPGRTPLETNRQFMTIVDWHAALKPTPLFRVGTWLVLAVVVGALAWRGRLTPPGAFATGIAASAIVYILSFGVFGVASDFRYAYWCVLVSLAGLVPALLSRRA
jgi:hypothetical protein